MRTTFVAILLALMVRCATADVIDNVITKLPDGWNDNPMGLIIMPKTASTEDVLQRVFQEWTPEFRQITNSTILTTRQVAIPCGHFPDAPSHSYTAVLVQPSQSEKIYVVFLRYIDVYESRAWLSAVYEAHVEETWKKIENDSFSFSVPKSFKQTAAHGIDSFVEEYVSDGIDLIFDYGAYSNDFQDWPRDTTFENLMIDGKAARIGTAAQAFRKGFVYSTQVHFEFGSLSMYAECKSENDVAVADMIFKTIAFKSERPWRAPEPTEMGSQADISSAGGHIVLIHQP